MSEASPSLYTPARPSIEPSAADFILDSYLMHIRTNECSACRAVEQWSEIHAIHVHRTKGVRRMVPVTVRDANYPIGLSHLPKRMIPVCHCCILATEPADSVADISDATARAAWQHTLLRKYAPTPATSPEGAARPAARPTLIADLESL